MEKYYVDSLRRSIEVLEKHNTADGMGWPNHPWLSEVTALLKQVLDASVGQEAVEPQP